MVTYPRNLPKTQDMTILLLPLLLRHCQMSGIWEVTSSEPSGPVQGPRNRTPPDLESLLQHLDELPHVLSLNTLICKMRLIPWEILNNSTGWLLWEFKERKCGKHLELWLGTLRIESFSVSLSFLPSYYFSLSSPSYAFGLTQQGNPQMPLKVFSWHCRIFGFWARQINMILKFDFFLDSFV